MSAYFLDQPPPDQMTLVELVRTLIVTGSAGDQRSHQLQILVSPVFWSQIESVTKILAIRRVSGVEGLGDVAVVALIIDQPRDPGRAASARSGQKNGALGAKSIVNNNSLSKAPE